MNTSNKTKLQTFEIKPVFKDERGEIFDILESRVDHVGIVTFKKSGVKRGNHYHKKSIQYSYVLDGKIKLITADLDGKNRKEIILTSGSFTSIPPKVVHLYVSMTSAKMIDLTTVSRKKDGYEKDTHRVDIDKI